MKARTDSKAEEKKIKGLYNKKKYKITHSKIEEAIDDMKWSDVWEIPFSTWHKITNSNTN